MSDIASTATLFERRGGRTRLHALLRHFYADVRQHREIGPIFTAQIHDWPAHLDKIADFWSGATGGPARYSGPMPYKHLTLGLEESILSLGSTSGDEIATPISHRQKPGR